MILSYYWFEQNVFSSLIANGNLFNVFSLIFVVKWLYLKEIDFKRLIRYIVLFTWVYSFLLIVLMLFDFKIEVVSPVDGRVDLWGANKLSKNLIFFTWFYYFEKYRTLRKYKYLFFLSWFLFVTQFFDIQRGDLVFLSSTIFIFYLLNSNHKFLSVILISIFGIVVNFLFYFVLEGTLIFDKFQQLLLLLEPSNWHLITDSSVGVRIREVEFALNYISQSPVFGFGLLRISNYSVFFPGKYFHLGDIGLFGVMFSFGAVGLIYFLFLLKKSIQIQKLVSVFKFDLIGINLSLLFFVSYTIKSGLSIYFPFIPVFCYLMIFYIKDKQNFRIVNKF